MRVCSVSTQASYTKKSMTATGGENIFKLSYKY